MQPTTTTTSPSPATSPADRRWSFRRFGADVEAQATSDTWDAIYRHGRGLVAEIDARKGDLYEAEASVAGPIDANIAELPSKVAMRTLRKHIRTTTQDLLERTASAEEDEDGTVHLQVPATQWKRFRELAEQMDGLGKSLEASVQSTAEAVRNTQQSLRALDKQLKEFVAVVWALNSQRARAFPPYFTDLGPLHASVYGMGCMTTATTTAKPKPQ